MRNEENGLFGEAKIEMMEMRAEEFDGMRVKMGGWFRRNRGSP